MNLVGYVGNLTSDVELKATPQGVSVATFTIAVKRPYKKDVTDFFRCVAWRGEAEFISRYFHKGDYISVNGYNTTRSYKKKVGGEELNISAVELMVERAEFCGSKNGQSQQSTEFVPPSASFEEVPPDYDLPF